MRVQAGAGGGASERDLAEPPERRGDARLALADLGGVAAELLAEGDRDRVHPVRAAGLDDVGELGRLRLERCCETVQRRQEVTGHLLERGEVHSGWEDVVRALAHVDVIVWMHVLAGERGDHLVRIRVRRGTGAGLEDVDRELIVELARGDAVAGGCDAHRLVGIEQSELSVHAGGSGLDPAEPARDGSRDRLSGDGEVRDRLARLASPELLMEVCRHGLMLARDAAVAVC